MEAQETLGRILSLASLQRTRALLANRRARLLATSIAALYMFLSMVIGQMLTFLGFSGPFFATVQWIGNPWWDFPELFVFSNGVALDLLLLPTVSMVLVSAGVGIGATAALVSVWPVLRGRSKERAREAATASTAGASAAVTGLATMGACCCSSCAGAAGVEVVAAASGTNLFLLLGQNWYLDLFQLVVLGVALMAQERAFRLPADACRVRPKVDARFVLGALLRVGLLVASITWSLAMFVEWVETPPLAAGPALWYHWIVEHQLLSVVAFAAAMFPREMAAWIRKAYARAGAWPFRVLLLVGGVTWGIGVPPALTGLGLGGFLNELLGVLGAPATWGAIAPDTVGAALVFHWAFQHLLLSAFAIALAVRPRLAMAPLLRTVEGAAPGAPPEPSPAAST